MDIFVKSTRGKQWESSEERNKTQLLATRWWCHALKGSRCFRKMSCRMFECLFFLHASIFWLDSNETPWIFQRDSLMKGSVYTTSSMSSTPDRLKSRSLPIAPGLHAAQSPLKVRHTNHLRVHRVSHAACTKVQYAAEGWCRKQNGQIFWNGKLIHSKWNPRSVFYIYDIHQYSNV